MPDTQINVRAESYKQPAIFATTGHTEAPPKQVLTAEFPIEVILLLPFLLVAFIGWETKHPRDTDDDHQPDLDRQQRRKDRRARINAVPWQK